MELIPDFELDYRKDEIDRYAQMLDDGKVEIMVPTQSLIRILSENLSYRARLDHLMETILRHNFTIPQRIIMPNDMKISSDTPPISKE